MLSRKRISEITRLALPIAVGMGSSFIMVLIDLAMIGRLGNVALAAVGLSVFANGLVVAFVAGVTPAVQGIVARRIGEKSSEPKCLPLNGGLGLVLVLGIPLFLLFYLVTPFLFSAIASDPLVVEEGVPYLRAILFALIAVGMNNAFHGFWNGIGRVRIFMTNVIFMNCLNVLLNYMLIFGNFGAPELGTLGAGIASAVSFYVGLLIYFLVTHMYYRKDGFMSVKPEKTLLVHIFKIGLPAALQMATFSLGFIVFYWIVGKVGTAELAAINVLVRVSLLLTLFAEALGMASATLVSTSLGEGEPNAAAEWGWDIAKLGVIFITILGLPMLLTPEWFLSLFLTDQATIEMAIMPARITAALSGVASLIMIFATTLVSLGDGKRVLLVSFCTQWMFFLPAVWIVGPLLKYGLLEITYVQGLYGLLATGLITAIWHGGRWKEIKI